MYSLRKQIFPARKMKVKLKKEIERLFRNFLLLLEMKEEETFFPLLLVPVANFSSLPGDFLFHFSTEKNETEVHI